VISAAVKIDSASTFLMRRILGLWEDEAEFLAIRIKNLCFTRRSSVLDSWQFLTESARVSRSLGSD
jgi:hypothetical protein